MKILKNVQKKNMGGKIRKKINFITTMMATYMCLMMNEIFAFADETTATPSTNAITQPLTNLKTLMIAIVTGIGGILIVKAIMEIAQAYSQQDSASMSNAIKQLIAGIIMAMVSTVLLILGV